MADAVQVKKVKTLGRVNGYFLISHEWDKWQENLHVFVEPKLTKLFQLKNWKMFTVKNNPQYVKSLFQKLDEDHNGSISSKEIFNIFKDLGMTLDDEELIAFRMLIGTCDTWHLTFFIIIKYIYARC